MGQVGWKTQFMADNPIPEQFLQVFHVVFQEIQLNRIISAVTR
jgi:hypothetical protein